MNPENWGMELGLKAEDTGEPWEGCGQRNSIVRSHFRKITLVV